MVKTVLVVCDRGNSSAYYSAAIRQAADQISPNQFDFFARGIFAKVPTDQEIASATAILTSFGKNDLKRLVELGFPADYIESWKAFLEKMEAKKKAVFPFNDLAKGRPVEPKAMLAEIEKIKN